MCGFEQQNKQILTHSRSNNEHSKKENHEQPLNNMFIMFIINAPVLLFGCEVWMVRYDWNNIRTAKMKNSMSVKGCARADLIRNTNVRKKLDIFLKLRGR